MAESHQLGKAGEELAVNHLETHGYIVVDRNVALRHGELDIIARESGDLVFVEVKTRRGDAFGTPSEAVTPDKARSIARSAQEYLYQNLITGENVRCDVVGIMMPDQGDPEIEVFKNAVPLGDLVP